MIPSKEPVVLVHGVWMRGISLGALSRRLNAMGFAAERFEYASLFHSPEQTVERLRRRVRALGPGPVHVVGHSLGGLLALEAFRGWQQAPPGRLVALGSPFCGSAVARSLLAKSSRLPMLGRSARMLAEGVMPWHPSDRDVGVIAGTHPYGLGSLLGGLVGQNDGTVAVAETRLPGVVEEKFHPVSHTGLVFSQAVAEDVAAFLRQGRFTD